MSFDTERFIKEIKKRPCIWDVRSDHYPDRNKKNKSWDEIVDIFKEKDEITHQDKKELISELHKKWKSIRGCFTRELNRRKALKSGFNSGPRKNEYIYYKQLLFLKPVIGIKEPDPLVTTSSLSCCQSILRPKEDHQEAGNCPKRMKSERYIVFEEDKISEGLNKSMEKRQEAECMNLDEDRLFMLSLVNTLKRVPPERKIATKIKLMTTLDEATHI